MIDLHLRAMTCWVAKKSLASTQNGALNLVYELCCRVEYGAVHIRALPSPDEDFTVWKSIHYRA